MTLIHQHIPVCLAYPFQESHEHSTGDRRARQHVPWQGPSGVMVVMQSASEPEASWQHVDLSGASLNPTMCMMTAHADTSDNYNAMGQKQACSWSIHKFSPEDRILDQPQLKVMTWRRLYFQALVRPLTQDCPPCDGEVQQVLSELSTP